ncbi:trimethyllysine dioxygenase, mitochondrial [Cherax quadricarinatus]|nr:trimethyllysine dioxygenase, mitochondrial-like [Cherax quadricarinatus]
MMLRFLRTLTHSSTSWHVSCTRLVRRPYCSVSVDTKVLECGAQVELHHPRWPHSLYLPYLWLRDHCRCPLCYNHKTHQRIYDVNDINLNIRPAAVSTTKEVLKIKWPDGHNSEYEYKFLWQNSFEGQRTSYKVPRLLWKATTFPAAHLTTVPLGDLYDPEKDGVRRLIYSVIRHGFAFISEVPADTESTEAAIEKICLIKKTFFGEMWSMQANNFKHYDTAYSTDFIGAHTDNTYFSQASRIQVFHCLQPATEGGKTLLVDGFNIAKQFQEKYPEGYEFLSSEAIPSEFIEEGKHHLSLDTVFKNNPVTGNIQQIRYNIYDRAPLSSLPMKKIQEFYLHFNNLTRIVRNPKNEYWLKLEPGTVLLSDNWRLMHGRSNFSGMRAMTGCYLDNEEFTSKARSLNIQLD